MKTPAESFKISRQFFCFFFFFFFFFFFIFAFLLKIMYLCFLLFKKIFKVSRKEKNHFTKITVSRQFSIREIGNFGTDQLRDRGRIQW